MTVEGAGRFIAGAATIYHGYEFFKKPTLGRGLETIVSGISMLPGAGWAIGAGFFFADILTKSFTGKSIQENIDGE